jgi:transposase-like protein
MNRDNQQVYFCSEYPNLAIYPNGEVYKFTDKSILKLKPHNRSKSKGGYSVLVRTINNKRVSLYVHRLVAKGFIPNPDNKSFVNHIDGNMYNNTVENLEWMTHSENVRDRYRIHGVNTFCPDPSKRFSNSFRKEIFDFIQRNPDKSISWISRELGISRPSVRRYRNELQRLSRKGVHCKFLAVEKPRGTQVPKI